MSKKIFLLFFTLFTFSLKVPAYDFENAGIYYTVSSRQKYTVAVTSSPQQRSAYRGEIVVPPSVVYEGKTFRVTEISKRAFQGCAQLVSLTVPASVVEIGDSAFFACTGLKYLVLEDGEKPLRVGSNSYHGVSAGQAIFHDCPLETLYLGRELQYEGGFFYGYSPFYKKKELSLVVVGDGVRTLENRAFYGCESLESVTIGGRVASVGNFAFYACKMLKELVVKEGNLPLEIGTNGNGKNLFSDAPLETLYLGRDLHYPESVGEIYNPFFQKGTLRTVTIGESAREIGSHAFQGCHSLVSFTVGSGVDRIGDRAFSGCISLRELFFKDGEGSLFLGVNRHSTSSKGEALFFDCPIETLYLGRTLDYSTSYFDGYAPFYDQQYLQSVVVGEEVVSLGDRLFWGCHSLSTVTIGGAVEFIGNYVFKECTALTEVVFRDGELPLYVGYNKFSPNGIGEPLFSDSHLHSLYLGRTLTYNMSRFYGLSPFYQQTELSSVTVSDYVMQLSQNIFYNCSALTELVIPGSVSAIDNAAFLGCTSLKKLELKDGRAPLSLGYNLFSEMEGRTLFHDTAVETLYLGRNLQFLSGEEYGGAPFSRMKKLQSVVVGDEVTAIPDDLFKNCPVLESFVVGKAVETIGNRAFQGCGNLSRLVFRDGDKPLLLGYNVHEPSGLGRSLFYDNPIQQLYLGRELRYPDTIYYGYAPFYRKETLTEVTIGEGVSVVGDRLFYGCTQLDNLQIEGTLSVVGAYAFYGCPAKE